MISRAIQVELGKSIRQFPVVTVTGTRQCGKTTLLKHALPEYQYVSLEDPDIRELAMEDPRAFLSDYDDHVIIDEAQRVPQLFSYIQTKIDSRDETGQYILSGSHNFLLMESISQSLAGRCAVLKMAPFSIGELKDAGLLPESVWKQMLVGGYPRLYDKKIEPTDYFPSYVMTYIERDVRSVRRITDSAQFSLFVRLCAARVGQVLNMAALANETGISVPTANAWLSILEQSYVIYRLHPYYRNYSKRLIKSPKLYFYDTGLLCYFLGIETEEQLKRSDHSGAVFEDLIVTEYLKQQFILGREPAAWFWRDTNQNEVDLLTERGADLHAYEIKLSETMNRKFLKGLEHFSNLAGIPASHLTCLYRGKDYMTSKGAFANYQGYVFP